MFRYTPVLIASAAIAATASSGQAALVITEVMAQTLAASPSMANGDYWELVNTGPTAVNLEGYSWGDSEDTFASGEVNYFPSLTIPANGVLIVLDEDENNVPVWRADWNLPESLLVFDTDAVINDTVGDPEPTPDVFSGLGGSNDGVFLYDPAGNTVASFAYGNGTRGFSFERSASGTDLGLSVAGENGAYLSVPNSTGTSNVGSPGFAVGLVPEPASLGLLGLGGLALLRRRRI